MKTNKKVEDAKKVTESKMRKVTMKSLKAWLEHTEMIMADIDLCKTEERAILGQVKEEVKRNFINSKL